MRWRSARVTQYTRQKSADAAALKVYPGVTETRCVPAPVQRPVGYLSLSSSFVMDHGLLRVL